ncbi:MAG: diguanylate cyclase [Rhodospirillales bacterium 20-60-12]|nr:MAG: diguanylate cyclase [Rhodospirillales bacterium 20-60-12]HQT66519.1 dihydroneopterin aldolase [Acetobacteraceae bacterium]
MDQSRLADATRALRHMFIRDLVLPASIGVYPHEHQARQRVRINLDLAIEDDSGQTMSRPAIGRDELDRVVDYEAIVIAVRALVAGGHVQLVETLAERLAELCLMPPKVRIARVRVEKLDVFPDAFSAGIEVERRR